MGAPGEEREKGREIFEATMSEHFQKLMIDDKPPLQEAARTACRLNAKTKQNKTLNISMSYSDFRKAKTTKSLETKKERHITYSKQG